MLATAPPPEPETAAEIGRRMDVVDRELETAIRTFERAGRMTLERYVKAASDSPHHIGTEEADVRSALAALIRAELQASEASELLGQVGTSLRAEDAAAVREVELRFRSVLHELREHPSAGRFVGQLRHIKKAIPQHLARRYATP